MPRHEGQPTGEGKGFGALKAFSDIRARFQALTGRGGEVPQLADELGVNVIPPGETINLGGRFEINTANTAGIIPEGITVVLADGGTRFGIEQATNGGRVNRLNAENWRVYVVPALRYNEDAEQRGVNGIILNNREAYQYMQGLDRTAGGKMSEIAQQGGGMHQWGEKNPYILAIYQRNRINPEVLDQDGKPKVLNPEVLRLVVDPVEGTARSVVAGSVVDLRECISKGQQNLIDLRVLASPDTSGMYVTNEYMVPLDWNALVIPPEFALPKFRVTADKGEDWIAIFNFPQVQDGMTGDDYSAFVQHQQQLPAGVEYNGQMYNIPGSQRKVMVTDRNRTREDIVYVKDPVVKIPLREGRYVFVAPSGRKLAAFRIRNGSMIDWEPQEGREALKNVGKLDWVYPLTGSLGKKAASLDRLSGEPETVEATQIVDKTEAQKTEAQKLEDIVTILSTGRIPADMIPREIRELDQSKRTKAEKALLPEYQRRAHEQLMILYGLMYGDAWQQYSQQLPAGSAKEYREQVILAVNAEFQRNAQALGVTPIYQGVKDKDESTGSASDIKVDPRLVAARRKKEARQREQKQQRNR